MNIRLVIPAMTLAALVSGCASYGDGPGYGPGPRASAEENWDATHYYRDGDYQDRVLTSNDRVYYGSDGRYYCKRPDGTAGLVIGGVTGGVLGNVIAPGGSKTLGTLLGTAGGAAIGNAVEKNSTHCR